MAGPDTIPRVVLSAGERFGGAEAVVDGPLRLSFADLAERVRVAAGAFAPVTPEDLIAWSRTRMAGYKVPGTVQFLDTLPLNATGKVMKDQLR